MSCVRLYVFVYRLWGFVQCCVVFFITYHILLAGSVPEGYFIFYYLEMDAWYLRLQFRLSYYKLIAVFFVLKNWQKEGRKNCNDQNIDWFKCNIQCSFFFILPLVWFNTFYAFFYKIRSFILKIMLFGDFLHMLPFIKSTIFRCYLDSKYYVRYHVNLTEYARNKNFCIWKWFIWIKFTNWFCKLEVESLLWQSQCSGSASLWWLSGSGSEFPFWCRSTSGMASKRCQSTCESFPTYYLHMLENQNF